MTNFRPALLAASLFALTASTAPTHAQLARTFVSSFGNDANDCARGTPCRTFQRAHDNTFASGEITVLDPGGYGAVSINRTISIINDGVGEGGVLVSGDAIGITVNAGPSDRVSLRGLTIKGIAFGDSNGIRFNSGASLTIENCAVRNNSGDGIAMLGNVPSGTTRTLTLSNTFVSDNGSNGIFIQPTGSGNMRVVLNRVEMYNNGAHGLGIAAVAINQTIRGAVTESVSANNGLAGFVASGIGPNTVGFLKIIRSVAAFNGTYGAQADAPGAGFAQVELSENLMSDNTIFDWGRTGGVMVSYGDNIGNGDPQTIQQVKH